MLLNFRIQEKTETVVFTAPDQTVYTWQPGNCETDDDKTKLFAEIGRTVLEVLNDPDQPEVRTEPGQVRAGQGGASAPGPGMGDLMNEARRRSPLLDNLLTFAEGISSDDPEGD